LAIFPIKEGRLPLPQIMGNEFFEKTLFSIKGVAKRLLSDFSSKNDVN